MITPKIPTKYTELAFLNNFNRPKNHLRLYCLLLVLESNIPNLPDDIWADFTLNYLGIRSNMIYGNNVMRTIRNHIKTIKRFRPRTAYIAEGLRCMGFTRQASAQIMQIPEANLSYYLSKRQKPNDDYNNPYFYLLQHHHETLFTQDPIDGTYKTNHERMSAILIGE